MCSARKRARRRVRRSAQATAWKVGDGHGSCRFGLDTSDGSCARVRKPCWNTTRGSPRTPHEPGPALWGYPQIHTIDGPDDSTMTTSHRPFPAVGAAARATFPPSLNDVFTLLAVEARPRTEPTN